MQSWSKSAKECYKRHIIAVTYESHPCRTLINSMVCENFTGDDCQLKETIKKMFKEIGPPKQLPHIGWKMTPELIKLSEDEEKLISALKGIKEPLTKNGIAALTGFDISGISSRISRLNQKRANLIMIIKKDGRSSYILNFELLEDLK